MKEYLTELDFLIERSIKSYSKKIENNSNEQFNKVLSDFNSSIANIGTEIIHKSIIDGLANSDITTEVQNRLSSATKHFIELNQKH
jgi:hypothetical protein